MSRRLFRLAIGSVVVTWFWSGFSGPGPGGSPGSAQSPEEQRAPGAPQAFGAAQARRPAQVPEPPPSVEEIRIQRQLEAQVRGEAHSDRVTMADGRVLLGRVIEDSPKTVRLLRSFGDSGEMEMTLRRAEVRSIERDTAKAPPVSLRDVRFKLEFADFNIYRRPPFTIVTDQSFFQVEDATRTLEQLHSQFVPTFRPLITRPERSDGIQLLFFSDERRFASYRDHYATALRYASGFYSVLKDRLVIFDQEHSDWADKVGRQIDDERDRYRAPAEANDAQVALHQWHTTAKRTLQVVTARANRVILRHEGAHQLFHTYGVHSEQGVEHLWLVEGLAGYCEPRDGETSDRLEELRQNKGMAKAKPFGELVNFARPEGFGALGDDTQVGLAYAKSWFLVDYLMRENRKGFFDYIRFVRDPANERELAATPDFELLSRFCGRSSVELELALQRELERV